MTANLCEHCTAMCCRYVALPIETPDTFSEFEDIRWYLIHENIAVFIEDDEWFISFHTPCRHIQDDFRCGIYETRPQICRRYTTDNCDYHSGDYGWSAHFTSPEHLDAYLAENPDAITDAKRGKSKRAKGKKRVPRRTKPAQADRAGVPLPVLPSGAR